METRGNVVVHSLSTTGALIEADFELAAGAYLDVFLPEGDCVRSKVVWSKQRYLGCQFQAPISTALLNRALLKGEHVVVREAPLPLDINREYSSHRDPDAWSRSVRIVAIVGASLTLWAAAILAFWS